MQFFTRTLLCAAVLQFSCMREQQQEAPGPKVQKTANETVTPAGGASDLNSGAPNPNAAAGAAGAPTTVYTPPITTTTQYTPPPSGGSFPGAGGLGTGGFGNGDFPGSGSFGNGGFPGAGNDPNTGSDNPDSWIGTWTGTNDEQSASLRWADTDRSVGTTTTLYGTSTTFGSTTTTTQPISRGADSTILPGSNGSINRGGSGGGW
jgi:hypothetical protein